MPCPTPTLNRIYELVDGPDVQVTFSAANQSRSESVVGVNPTNSQNLICASKRFIDPHKYHFTISTSHSFDGGQTWTESPPQMLQGWDGMTDPDLTFDHHGHAYLIVEPLTFGQDLTTIGMYVYKSIDGGVTWGTPVQLHLQAGDDKQWITSDMSKMSPYRGRVYAAWGAGTPLRFARSSDGGATWQGMGNLPSGSDVSFDQAYAPSISIDDEGTVHISWHIPGSQEIMYTRSTNGGDSFEPVTAVVTGVASLTSFLPSKDGWAHFPNATFRVLTIVTSCIAAGKNVVLAWADYREGVSRIYFRIGMNSGTTWTGLPGGQPLLIAYGQPGEHHFHPQLSTAGDSAVGCAFYEFGLKQGQYLIDTKATFSCDDAAGFNDPINVTDRPWDPAVNAPWSHGDMNVTFIGEYFGFDASHDWFAVVWTDTRTGVQELFYDAATVVLHAVPIYVPAEVATILAGVIQDGGGLIFVGGKIIRIPPWDPWIDVLYSMAAMDSVKNIRTRGADRAMSALRNIVVNVAHEEEV